jgi:ribonuclease HII
MNENLKETILVGIDEAGLGPILGPLVVSAAAFSVPVEKTQCDMWELLSDSVSANKKNLAGRILVCDSKKAYTPAIGIGFLEKTILTFLKFHSRVPNTAGELMDLLCPQNKAQVLGCPWYKNIDQQKIGFNADEISISASVLKKNLNTNGIALTLFKSYCLEAGEYNELVQKIRNKSSVVFNLVCRLIDEVIRSTKHKNYHFIIDRQGGRTHYGPTLRTMFGNMELKILKEEENFSSYQLISPYKNILMDFAVKADDDFLPVCLASMACKYLREQLMISHNNFFIEKCADLKPTAGYWTDGKRFLKDLKAIAPHIQFNPNQLIRSR